MMLRQLLARQRGGRASEEELARRQKALEERFARRRAELEERLRARTGDEYLLQTLSIEGLPSEEFYAFLAPEDLNPVIAYPDGYAVVDARIIANRAVASS